MLTLCQIPQGFRGPVGPILECLKRYFFHKKIFLLTLCDHYNLYMNFNNYVHAAVQAKIRPLVKKLYPSNRKKCRNIFFNVEIFCLVIATVKTRPVLKRAWQGLLDNWSTQWVMLKNVMVLSHDLKPWLFQQDPLTLPTVYTNYLKALVMLFQKKVLFSR